MFKPDGKIVGGHTGFTSEGLEPGGTIEAEDTIIFGLDVDEFICRAYA